jgi:hypothetical protein
MLPFNFLPDTLFLAVNLLDRYCSRRVVHKKHYQLVGCAALLIAAKYGDQKERVPRIRELQSMCCFLYEDAMFKQMEWHILNTMEWRIGYPTVDNWLKLALENNSAYRGVEVKHMAQYLCEIALYYKEFVSLKPSVMTRASLDLSRGILSCPDFLEIRDHAVSSALLNLWYKALTNQCTDLYDQSDPSRPSD